MSSTDIQLQAANRNAASATRPLPAPENRTTAAVEQFLEQTPWANPQHPAHANSLTGGFGTRRRSIDNSLAVVSSAANASTNGAATGEVLQPSQKPLTPPTQQQQQPQPPSQNPFAVGSHASTAPSFHILANNQLYKVPVAEVVHPSTGMLVNSVTDPSSSPILGVTGPVNTSGEIVA